MYGWYLLWVKKTGQYFFFPGTKYEVYKYFNQKIFFLNNWNWNHYFQVEDLSHQKVQCKLHSCLFVCLFVCFCFVFPICLRKQPILGYTTTGFPVKWQLVCVLCKKFASTNQMHYPDLGNKTSSVWNFYSHSSDQCHFIGKSVMDSCQERSWWCSHATLLSPLVVCCTLHTHSCADW